MSWSRIATALNAGATLREIGDAAGVGKRQAIRLLHLIQSCNVLSVAIEPHGRKRWSLTAPFISPPDDQWTEAEIETLRTATNEDAASALGVSVRTVQRERQRLGIDPPRETKACAICGTEFAARVGQLTCSRDCSAAWAARLDDTPARKKTMRERARRRYLNRQLREASDAIAPKDSQ